ncbi:UNVERIFIED_CONTAM: hypothetical protein Slati_3693200 [Sesamum latifolium]|uniref:Reverse transcriptase n=1 Tax=Sesamum latifolium TaxID=2727402 RepID=A0AAW2U1C1_9LAMI
MNLGKSAIVLSKNTLTHVRTELALYLGVPEVAKHDKYLALPYIIGKSKRAVFDSIRDQIWRKMQCWSAKKLSQDGHVVMIKSVMQAIPTFAMSSFKFLEALITEIKVCWCVFLASRCGQKNPLVSLAEGMPR